MGNIKDEILVAVNNLNIQIKEVSATTVDELITNIATKYTKGRKHGWLWENMVDNVCVSNKDAWKWLGEFIGNSESIMFFNPPEERIAFVFLSGHDLVSVLSETYGFEFYITNNTLDYLMCFNHHDILIACGNAKSWLEKYKTPEYDS